MTYKENLLLRKRVYTIDEYGVTIVDNGFFKSSSHFISFDKIGISVNYTSGDIIKYTLIILALIGSTIVVIYNYDGLWMIIPILFISLTVFCLISIVKDSKYKGTIHFSENKKASNNELFLKTEYPLNGEAEMFISTLRSRYIEHKFKKILEDDSHYNTVQSNYLHRLNNLKSSLRLNASEYNLLLKRLNSFFRTNDIPKSINYS